MWSKKEGKEKGKNLGVISNARFRTTHNIQGKKKRGSLHPSHSPNSWEEKERKKKKRGFKFSNPRLPGYYTLGFSSKRKRGKGRIDL